MDTQENQAVKLDEPSAKQRRGFRLSKLLPVIAIVLVLLGLLAANLVTNPEDGPSVNTRKEISVLAQAAESFQREIRVDYLPSRLLLKEDGDYELVNPSNAALAKDSVRYLKKAFPGIKFSAGIDWNGNGLIDQGVSGSIVLDGSQCLAFFLGGINGTQGFSTDPKNPANLAGRMDRIGPFYSFERGRLTPGAFPRYMDPWDTPYAYFSNYGRENGYNRYGDPNLHAEFPVSSDCGIALEPYYYSPNEKTGKRSYCNSRSFQIISAGKDTKFGPGGLWGVGVGIAPGTADDISNFHNARLGKP